MIAPSTLAEDRAAGVGGHAVELRDVTVRFGSTAALDAVTTTIRAGAIVGVLGRNGAGKSTLLSTVAAYRRPTAGTVLVAGRDPYEDEALMADTCLVRHDGDFNHDLSVADTVGIAASFRPHLERDELDRLLDRFQLTADRRKVGALSRGQRAALAVAIGIATRSPVTLFDEPHLGLDAPSRYAFYDELLATYLDRPRSIVVSTHLIDEMAALFEDVVILDAGRVLVDRPAEALRSLGVEITGPTAVVDELTAGLRVLSARTLGPTRSVVVYGELDDAVRTRAASAGVERGPIPLQDLFVALTSQEPIR